jgi:hypothetical protein
MLDYNGTKLKPKKFQVHGIDIWARCHTKYWKELENKQEMKHSRFMKCNNCIN